MYVCMLDQKKGKRKLHITADKNWLQQRKNDQRGQKRIHFTLSNRCEDELIPPPVSRILATVLE